ncbi:MAG: DUF4922 domain-containing protein [Muribaculaceae bacterium]
MNRLRRNEVETFFDRQLSQWPEVAERYSALGLARWRDVAVAGVPYRLQFNPARIVSSSAKVDARTISARRCFLCDDNSPEEQISLEIGGKYSLRVNPYPIFSRHFTVSSHCHVPQAISGRIADMLAIAKALDGYTVFYNGPCCGASAPDHMHFQVAQSGAMPREADITDYAVHPLARTTGSEMCVVGGLPFSAFLIAATDSSQAVRLFDELLAALPVAEDETEPKVNILCWHKALQWQILVVPRRCHRPSCYYAGGRQQMLISPASVDVAGLMIMPIADDFERITAADIETILGEVCFDESQIDKIVKRISR